MLLFQLRPSLAYTLGSFTQNVNAKVYTNNGDVLYGNKKILNREKRMVVILLVKEPIIPPS